MIPMPVPITSWTYPTVFYTLFFALPLAPAIVLFDPKLEPTLFDWVFSTTQFFLFVGSFVLIQWRCSSWAISYWQAIGAKTVGLESGCMNITIVYMLPLLFLYHIKFFFIALASLFLGRYVAQVATLDLVKNKLARRYPYAEVRRRLKEGLGPDPSLFQTMEEKTIARAFDEEQGGQGADAGGPTDDLVDAFEQMQRDHRGD